MDGLVFRVLAPLTNYGENITWIAFITNIDETILKTYSKFNNCCIVSIDSDSFKLNNKYNELLKIIWI